jgi:hypothetical protein
MPTLLWKHIQEEADAVFDLWEDQRELSFAEPAWGYIVAAKLADYITPLEETRVKVRLLCLGCMYFDFCSVTKIRSALPDFDKWSEAVKLDLSMVAQLIGASNVTGKDSADESQFRRRALVTLTDGERDGVYRALLKGYRDALKIYSSLWHSTHSPDAGRWEDLEWETTSLNAAGFEFVMGGCARTRNYG